MNKKILIILGLVILLSLGLGVVLLLGNKQNQPAAPQESVRSEIKKLVDEVVVSPIRSYDGTAIWYFNAAGRLFRINIDGSGLTEYPLPPLSGGSLSHALWPESGGNFIVAVLSSFGQVKYAYDYKQSTYVQLPEAMQEVDWLPDGERIVYVWKSGDGKQQLKIALLDSSGFTTITDLYWPDYVVKASPRGDEALLIRANPILDINKIYKVDLRSGRFEPVIEEGKNLAVLWVPGGEKFIFAQATPAGTSRLLLYNFQSRQTSDLNLATSIDKIALDADGQTLYAAVVKSNNLGDEFIKQDLLTLKQEKYFEPKEDIKVRSLLEVKDQLLFVNLLDSKLYYVSK